MAKKRASKSRPAKSSTIRDGGKTFLKGGYAPGVSQPPRKAGRKR